MADEDVIRAAVQIVVAPALRLLQYDNHYWSERPCSTCRAITSMVGQDFGCILFAKERRRVAAPTEEGSSK